MPHLFRSLQELAPVTPGPLKYLKVYEYEKGAFPDVQLHFQWIPCYHCEKPACVDACPSGVLQKESKYGAVLVGDSDACTGCRMCYDACPYGVPVFASDDLDAKVQKCDMCIDRLEAEISRYAYCPAHPERWTLDL